MDEALKTAITAGFTDVSGIVKDVVLLSVPVMITAIGVKRGALFALNWLKGLFSKA